MTAGAVVAKSGYNTTMVAVGAAVAAGACVGAANVGYYATAAPIGVGTTGTRGFATDNGGTVFQDTSRRASPDAVRSGRHDLGDSVG